VYWSNDGGDTWGVLASGLAPIAKNREHYEALAAIMP
jgi:hypothetical protein